MSKVARALKRMRLKAALLASAWTLGPFVIAAAVVSAAAWLGPWLFIGIGGLAIVGIIALLWMASYERELNRLNRDPRDAGNDY